MNFYSVGISASQQITEEVTSWPGVEAGPGRRGEFAFTLGRREIGHLHGDHAAHFSFPKDVWAELMERGRILQSLGETDSSKFDETVAHWTDLRNKLATQKKKPPEYYEVSYNVALTLFNQFQRTKDPKKAEQLCAGRKV